LIPAGVLKLRRFSIGFLSAAILMSGLSNSLAEDRYYFRFPSNSLAGSFDNEAPISKNISAYFIAGLGKQFSQQIPMKAEWEDNNWVIVDGMAPVGISFNPATRTFSGVPTRPVRGVTTKLVGYDRLGNVEAEAEVKFDVYEIPNGTQDVDLYAHTGQFFSKTLAIPSNASVQRWEAVSPPPAGVTYNGRFVEGTPTKAGSYPILNIGYDYNDNPVLAYLGTFVVEDGPTFAFIPDDLRKVERQASCDYGYECARWEQERLPEARATIGDWNKVRYVYEVQGELPSGLVIRQDAAPRAPSYKSGRVFDFYDQASVRIRAIDTDGAVGFSNWFKVGSLGPAELCKPIGGKSAVELNTVLGSPFFDSGYRIPVGLGASGLNVSLKSGVLPDGVRLDSVNGYLYGSATKQQEVSFAVEARIPSNPDFKPVECGPYKVVVSPGSFDLEASAISPLYRIGETLNLELAASGMILSGYSAEVASDESTLPIGLTFSSDGDKKWKLAGLLNEPGQYEAVVRLKNGDGVEKLRSVAFTVVDALHVSSVPNNEITVQQFASRPVSDPFYTFSWQNAIGATDVVLQGDFNGLSLTGSALYGGTVLAPGNYGPFSVAVSDSTNATAKSDDFNIKVTEREGLKTSGTQEQIALTVNNQFATIPFEVAQEPLAATVYTLDYTITPALPAGLRLDAKTGTIEGKPSIKGEYSGFVITATETGPAGGQALVSQPFDISVVDPAPIGDLRVAALEGNKDGVSVRSIDPQAILIANKANIVGAVSAVRFTHATPTVPGLNFEAATGTISGVATEGIQW
jgi:hypothetical protein